MQMWDLTGLDQMSFNLVINFVWLLGSEEARQLDTALGLADKEWADFERCIINPKLTMQLLTTNIRGIIITFW